MDISELKKVSDRSYDLALAKQNALEKAHSRMLVAYEGHLLKADAETINLVKNLSEDRQEFVILDINNNPVLVQDPKGLFDLLKSKNQEVLNSYHHTYQEFSKIR
jgi:hypothetical protein